MNSHLRLHFAYQKFEVVVDFGQIGDSITVTAIAIDTEPIKLAVVGMTDSCMKVDIVQLKLVLMVQ